MFSRFLGQLLRKKKEKKCLVAWSIIGEPRGRPLCCLRIYIVPNQ